MVESFLNRRAVILTTLITVKKAKEEVERLQRYITLVESYKADTVEKQIIKNYACTNSMAKVVKVMTDEGYSVDHQYVSSVISGKPSDELHRIIRTGYMKRTKPSRKSHTKSSYF